MPELTEWQKRRAGTQVPVPAKPKAKKKTTAKTKKAE